MDDLIAWLREQIDLDEQKADAASPGPWQLQTGSCSGWSWISAAERSVLGDFEVTCHPDGGQPDGTVSATDGEHIVNFDPDRARREVEAKRRLVELHSPANPDAVPREGLPGWPDRPWLYCKTCGSGEPYEYPTDWPCATLKLLALPFASQPGYRDEWRP